MRYIDADALIDDCKKYFNELNPSRDGKECARIRWLIGILSNALTIELEIVRCKDCEYGEQDEDGWWYCRSFGCQVGDEDGSGFCADAERKLK